MAKRVPGKAGLPVLGDKSFEFFQDAVQFTDRKINETKSRIFLSRLLNKPTVFIASNLGLHQLLNDNADQTDLGYKAFLLPIFGENLIFENGSEANRLRSLLIKVVNSDLSSVHQTVTSITKSELEQISHEVTVCPYEVFKRLATKICLSVILDIDFEKNAQLADDIVKLTAAHWHGITALPVNFKVPMSNSSSLFGKAMEAKQSLLELIRKRLEELPVSNCDAGSRYCPSFPQLVKDVGFASVEEAAQHLLLFTAAVMPKALASFMSSFVLALGSQPQMQQTALNDQESLTNILLEVLRLWPPFVCGRRLVRSDITVEGYHIPAGHAVMYMTWHAQRDPFVFVEPNEFIPDRWKNCDPAMRDGLYAFGSGPRCCIGQEFVGNIFKILSHLLLEKFYWENLEKEYPVLKKLPVSRPLNPVKVKFTPRSQGQSRKCSRMHCISNCQHHS